MIFTKNLENQYLHQVVNIFQIKAFNKRIVYDHIFMHED